MTCITTNVKHSVRTIGSEHQGQNSVSDPDQNFEFTLYFLSGMQETVVLRLKRLVSRFQLLHRRRFLVSFLTFANFISFVCSRQKYDIIMVIGQLFAA